MTRKWYGSLDNRLEENRMLVNEIEVGTKMTEYYWSDRKPYEVTRIQDQKHVYVRMMDHKRANSTAYSNDWILTSNENNPEKMITKRGNYWYWTNTITTDILEGLTEGSQEWFETMLYLAHNNLNAETLKEKGKVTKYHKANVTFGKAEYYYDYEF